MGVDTVVPAPGAIHDNSLEETTHNEKGLIVYIVGEFVVAGNPMDAILRRL